MNPVPLSWHASGELFFSQTGPQPSTVAEGGRPPDQIWSLGAVLKQNKINKQNPAGPVSPHSWGLLILTRGGQEIRMMVVPLMQRVMGMRGEEGGCGHKGVAIV